MRRRCRGQPAELCGKSTRWAAYGTSARDGPRRCGRDTHGVGAFIELALDLARELSEGGAHSVFVDLDAETAVSRKAGAQSGIGDLLLGKVSFGEAIERDPKSRAHILGAGRITPDIAAILSADRFSIVFGALAQSYDHIVIAAPNLIGYSSASRLARFTRGTVVVTLEGNSDAGIAAAETLRGMGFPNIAVVAVAPEPDPKVAPEVAAA